MSATLRAAPLLDPLAAASPAFLAPAALPAWQQGVWRADELDAGSGEVCTTGHAALDAELPGGGWPLGALTELLQPAPTAAVWTLLLPALAQAAAAGARVALIAPPLPPFLPALAAGGLPPAALLWVQAPEPAAPLWACEQALRCADVAAVLAWLPQARVAELRRLQLAAARQHSLLFVLRPARAAQAASPARLRVAIEPLPAADTGEPPTTLAVRILKRRGPPAAQPVPLNAQPPALAALLAAARQRRRGPAPPPPAAAEAPPRSGGARVMPWPGARCAPSGEAAHALDRPALARA